MIYDYSNPIIGLQYVNYSKPTIVTFNMPTQTKEQIKDFIEAWREWQSMAPQLTNANDKPKMELVPGENQVRTNNWVL